MAVLDKEKDQQKEELKKHFWKIPKKPKKQRQEKPNALVIDLDKGMDWQYLNPEQFDSNLGKLCFIDKDRGYFVIKDFDGNIKPVSYFDGEKETVTPEEAYRDLEDPYVGSIFAFRDEFWTPGKLRAIGIVTVAAMFILMLLFAMVRGS